MTAGLRVPERDAAPTKATEPTLVTAYKQSQRHQWDRAARELREWWPAFRELMAPVTDVMMAHGSVRSGARVVDVASGFGEPALTMAGLVGARGRVVATDLSASMLAVAAERARRLGLTNMEFTEMDAEEPTLTEGAFDTVVCRLGLMFLPDLDAALARLASLLVPSGRFVAAVWGPAQANSWLTHASHTLREFLELGAPPAGTPTVFDLGAPTVLDDALALAGLDDIRRTAVRLDFAWSSPGAFAAYHRASPLSRMVAGEGASRQAQAWNAVAEVAARTWGNGPISLTGQVVVVSGRR